MKRIPLILIAMALLAGQAQPAGIDLGLGLLRKKSKPEPAARVKQLAQTLQSDPDEKKRLQAAEELRSMDPRNNPDVIPALIGAIQKDPSPAVRIEAAESIGKLKPVYQPAGLALEAAQAADPDAKVREAAKSALWQYHLNGYRTPPGGNALATQTGEPPLASGRPGTAATPKAIPTPSAPSETAFKPISNGVGKTVNYQPTAEPPLAKPKFPTPAPAPLPKVETPAPLPTPLPAPLPASSVPEPKAPTPTVPVPTVPVPPLPDSGK